jgi:hypothetical protein
LGTLLPDRWQFGNYWLRSWRNIAISNNPGADDFWCDLVLNRAGIVCHEDLRFRLFVRLQAELMI